MDGGDFTTTSVYLTPPKGALKNASNGKFYVILSQLIFYRRFALAFILISEKIQKAIQHQKALEQQTLLETAHLYPASGPGIWEAASG